mgnify:CR=1 FL=1
MRFRSSTKIKGRARVYLAIFGLAALVITGLEGCSRPPAEVKSDPTALCGYWKGTLGGGTKKLSLNLHFVTNESGELEGVLNSLSQSREDIFLTSATFQTPRVAFKIEGLGVSYQGVLKTNESQIIGNWSQHGHNSTIVWEKTRHPFIEQDEENDEEVVVTNKQVVLHGTLSLPPGIHRPDAVLLVSGTGPFDRDEIIAGRPIFRVLTRNLTRNGMAVLRMDKRGVGRSTGDFDVADSYDFASDAEAALRYLVSAPIWDRTSA